MKRRAVLSSVAITAIAGCTSNSGDTGQTSTSEPADVSATQTPNTSTTTTTQEEAPAERISPTVEWESVAAAKVGSGHFFPAPKVIDGHLVVASGLNDAGTLEGFTLSEGKLDWEYSVGDSMLSEKPLPSNGSEVIIGTYYGLEAISASSGEVIWSEDIAVTGSMASDSNLIYVPRSRGVEARTYDGVKQWSWDSEGPITGLEVGDSEVFVKSETTLYAFNKNDGTAKWKLRTPLEPSVTPVADGKTLYIGDDSGIVTALDIETQEAKWALKFDNGIATPITVGEQNLYAAGWGYPVSAINSDNGEVQWTFDASYQPLSPVFESAGKAYVGSDRGVLYARDASNGGPKWSYESGSSIWAPPAIDGENVYLATESGSVVALSVTE